MRYITLKLTLMEAKALDQAVGNSLGSEEDAIAIMHSKRKVQAAYRAAQKLTDALRERGGSPKARPAPPVRKKEGERGSE